MAGKHDLDVIPGEVQKVAFPWIGALLCPYAARLSAGDTLFWACLIGGLFAAISIADGFRALFRGETLAGVLRALVTLGLLGLGGLLVWFDL